MIIITETFIHALQHQYHLRHRVVSCLFLFPLTLCRTSHSQVDIPSTQSSLLTLNSTVEILTHTWDVTTCYGRLDKQRKRGYCVKSWKRRKLNVHAGF